MRRVSMSIDGVGGKPPVDLVQFKMENRTYTASEKKHATVSSIHSGQDGFTVSAKAQEFLKVRSMVDSLPDVRLDKVNQLARAIDAGEYQPKAADIAAALIDKHLIDSKI
jgi:flagellar biosynthesis anti-sigma factor FlgM